VPRGAEAGAGTEAAYADTAIMSCTDIEFTIGFISSDQGPRRVPTFMSNNWRIV
jgi:hypothetical protein